MAVFVLVTEDEGLVDVFMNVLLSTTCPLARSNVAVAPMAPLPANQDVLSESSEPTKAERKSLRHLAEAICMNLNITPADSYLVAVLSPGQTTNLDAVMRWCKGHIASAQEDTLASELVDLLTAQLKKHLISKLH